MAILDKIICSLNSFVEDIVTVARNEDIFDKSCDFATVHRLMVIRHEEVPDILDIMIGSLKLVDDNRRGGRFTILTTLCNLRDDRNRRLFYDAMYKLHQEKQVYQFACHLEQLAVENHQIIQKVLAT